MIPEFSRCLSLSELGEGVVRSIEAAPAEREALAVRFGLRDLARLAASLDVVPVAGGVRVRGRVAAAATQACATSGEDVAASIDEPVDLLLLRGAYSGEDEIELDSSQCDVLPLEDGSVDLGEIVAQSLGLALDPYPRADREQLQAARNVLTSEEEAARRADELRQAANPFAVLKSPN